MVHTKNKINPNRSLGGLGFYCPLDKHARVLRLSDEGVKSRIIEAGIGDDSFEVTMVNDYCRTKWFSLERGGAKDQRGRAYSMYETVEPPYEGASRGGRNLAMGRLYQFHT